METRFWGQITWTLYGKAFGGPLHKGKPVFGDKSLGICIERRLGALKGLHISFTTRMKLGTGQGSNDNNAGGIIPLLQETATTKKESCAVRPPPNVILQCDTILIIFIALAKICRQYSIIVYSILLQY